MVLKIYSTLGYGTMQSYRWVSAFQRNIPPSSFALKMEAAVITQKASAVSYPGKDITETKHDHSCITL
jgi:hypothetical protein